jgi:hypothetical protein
MFFYTDINMVGCTHVYCILYDSYNILAYIDSGVFSIYGYCGVVCAFALVIQRIYYTPKYFLEFMKKKSAKILLIKYFSLEYLVSLYI